MTAPLIAYHHVLRIGATHPVATASRTAKDRATSDRCIIKGGVYPIIGRWIVRDYAPLIADLCGPMGRGG